MPIIRRFLIGLIPLAFVPATVFAQTAPARIGSQQELTRYRREAPDRVSPLNAPSPGGRKRFMGQLVIGERGLRSRSLGDPNNELNHEQALRLLALFGAASFASGVGVSKDEQVRRERERLVDATTRGCDVKTCPESEIEQRYDQLVMQQPGASLPDGTPASVDEEHDERRFKRYLLPSTVATTTSPDLRLLKRAVEFAIFHRVNPEHIDQLQPCWRKCGGTWLMTGIMKRFTRR